MGVEPAGYADRNAYTEEERSAMPSPSRWRTHNPAESNEVSIAFSGGKRCVIATVTFGSEVSLEVSFLRGFRDNLVRRAYLGERFYQTFDAFYYSWSTPGATYIAAHSALKVPVRLAIYPLIGALKLAALATANLF